MKNKPIFPILAFILAVLPLKGAYGQLTVEQCQDMARENYPLVRQYDLVERTTRYSLANASKGYLPQVSLSGKASYQSDVTQIPIEIPGVDIGARKDQYQVMAEIDQTIWDGGNIRSQRKLTKAQAEVDAVQTDVDLYAIRDRVNQLFFGILLLDEKLKQNSFLQRELGRNYTQVETYIANGIANQADLDAVKVEQLSAIQAQKELTASREAYLRMLSAFIGREIGEGDTLIRPQMPDISAATAIDRPELNLFTALEKQLDARKASVNARNLPKIGAFVQGAYANPGLNFLKDEFSAYYIAGVRLKWDFVGLYTRRNDMRLIELQRGQVDVQRETFLFNTHLTATEQTQEIEKYRKLLEDDDRIVELRGNICRSAIAKVAEGTMSVIEMLRQVTAQDMARQDRAAHQVQLLLSAYQYKNTINE